MTQYLIGPRGVAGPGSSTERRRDELSALVDQVSDGADGAEQALADALDHMAGPTLTRLHRRARVIVAACEAAVLRRPGAGA